MPRQTAAAAAADQTGRRPAPGDLRRATSSLPPANSRQPPHIQKLSKKQQQQRSPLARSSRSSSSSSGRGDHPSPVRALAISGSKSGSKSGSSGSGAPCVRKASVPGSATVAGAHSVRDLGPGGGSSLTGSCPVSELEIPPAQGPDAGCASDRPSSAQQHSAAQRAPASVVPELKDGLNIFLATSRIDHKLQKGVHALALALAPSPSPPPPLCLSVLPSRSTLTLTLAPSSPHPCPHALALALTSLLSHPRPHPRHCPRSPSRPRPRALAIPLPPSRPRHPPYPLSLDRSPMMFFFPTDYKDRCVQLGIADCGRKFTVTNFRETDCMGDIIQRISDANEGVFSGGADVYDGKCVSPYVPYALAQTAIANPQHRPPLSPLALSARPPPPPSTPPLSSSLLFSPPSLLLQV